MARTHGVSLTDERQLAHTVQTVKRVGMEGGGGKNEKLSEGVRQAVLARSGILADRPGGRGGGVARSARGRSARGAGKGAPCPALPYRMPCPALRPCDRAPLGAPCPALPCPMPCPMPYRGAGAHDRAGRGARSRLLTPCAGHETIPLPESSGLPWKGRKMSNRTVSERKAKVAEIRARIGGFSNPSKMPCYSWSIPATTCKIGSRLQGVAGSVCSSCYAMKGTYQFKSTRVAMARRFEILSRALETAEGRAQFVADFVRALLVTEKSGFFRFHDSGDLQSVDHFAMICDIARALPDMRFWIPTREAGIVRAYQTNGGKIPDNLTVRVSAPMVDVTVRALQGCATSAVYSPREYGKGATGRRHALPVVGNVTIGATVANACPAPMQDGHCADCRACWDRGTETVAYLRH